MNEKLLAEIKNRIINDIYVPAEEPRPNSEYHVGFNDCQIAYAEKKLKFIKWFDSIEQIS